MRFIRLAAIPMLAVVALVLAYRQVQETHHKEIRGTVSIKGPADLISTLAAVDGPQLVGLLAPVSPTSGTAGEAILATLAARSDLHVTLIWTPVLPWDLPQKSKKRSHEIVHGDAIRHALDPTGKAAQLIGEVIDWPADGPAWDVILFYRDGAVADGRLLPPDAWFHQHRGFAPERRRIESDLTAALLEVSR